MIPIRCFTCGKIIGNLWEPYKQKLQQDTPPNVALDELGLYRYCCRRMISSHLELSDKFLMYNCPNFSTTNKNGTENSCAAPESTPMNIQQQILRVSHPEKS